MPISRTADAAADLAATIAELEKRIQEVRTGTDKLILAEKKLSELRVYANKIRRDLDEKIRQSDDHYQKQQVKVAERQFMMAEKQRLVSALEKEEAAKAQAEINRLTREIKISSEASEVLRERIGELHVDMTGTAEAIEGVEDRVIELREQTERFGDQLAKVMGPFGKYVAKIQQHREQSEEAAAAIAKMSPELQRTARGYNVLGNLLTTALGVFALGKVTLGVARETHLKYYDAVRESARGTAIWGQNLEKAQRQIITTSERVAATTGLATMEAVKFVTGWQNALLIADKSIPIENLERFATTTSQIARATGASNSALDGLNRQLLTTGSMLPGAVDTVGRLLPGMLDFGVAGEESIKRIQDGIDDVLLGDASGRQQFIKQMLHAAGIYERAGVDFSKYAKKLTESTGIDKLVQAAMIANATGRPVADVLTDLTMAQFDPRGSGARALEGQFALAQSVVPSINLAELSKNLQDLKGGKITDQGKKNQISDTLNLVELAAGPILAERFGLTVPQVLALPEQAQNLRKTGGTLEPTSEDALRAKTATNLTTSDRTAQIVAAAATMLDSQFTPAIERAALRMDSWSRAIGTLDSGLTNIIRLLGGVVALQIVGKLLPNLLPKAAKWVGGVWPKWLPGGGAGGAAPTVAKTALGRFGGGMFRALGPALPAIGMLEYISESGTKEMVKILTQRIREGKKVDLTKQSPRVQEMMAKEIEMHPDLRAPNPQDPLRYPGRTGANASMPQDDVGRRLILERKGIHLTGAEKNVDLTDEQIRSTLTKPYATPEEMVSDFQNHMIKSQSAADSITVGPTGEVSKHQSATQTAEVEEAITTPSVVPTKVAPDATSAVNQVEEMSPEQWAKVDFNGLSRAAWGPSTDELRGIKHANEAQTNLLRQMLEVMESSRVNGHDTVNPTGL